MGNVEGISEGMLHEFIPAHVVDFRQRVTICPRCYEERKACIPIWSSSWDGRHALYSLPDGTRVEPERAGSMRWCSVCTWREAQRDEGES